MNYREATEYIQNLNKFGIKLGLDRVKRLLDLLGNPQVSFRSILVGGTSGKGSTTVMIGSVLKETGFRTGVFTKPHLFDFRERIAVDGDTITERDFVRLVEKIKPLAERMRRESEYPTFFEFVTAMAFEYFREKKVGFAVLEVGLGGRLDATNVANAEVSVITNVSLEHTEILGPTVEKIAVEKAGIVKENGILVTGSDDPKVLRVLEKICMDRNSRFVKAGKLKNAESTERGNGFELDSEKISVPLAGKYQLRNISCALAALDSLDEKIPIRAIKDGLEKVRWPGRFEVVNAHPKVLLDGAKDSESIKCLMDSLDLIAYDKLYCVFGVSNDKNADAMVDEASKKSDFFILAKHGVMGRGMEPELLAKEVKKCEREFLIVPDVKCAVKKAMELAGKDGLVLVTGSLFTVAEARELWFGGHAKMGREFNENTAAGSRIG
jgi:dihydrofolate synthase/folylpolyglutamate synthase